MLAVSLLYSIMHYEAKLVVCSPRSLLQGRHGDTPGYTHGLAQSWISPEPATGGGSLRAVLTGSGHYSTSFAGCGGRDAKKGLAVPCEHSFMPQSLSILAGVPGALGTVILAIYFPCLL